MSKQDPTFAIVKQRVKDYNLTDEEKLAIDTARRQLSSRIKRKQLSPLRSIVLVGGGFIIGSQLGFVAGITAGISTINRLPNPERLKNLVIDVQNEVMAARGYTRDSPTSRPRPMTPEERQNTRISEVGLEQPSAALGKEPIEPTQDLFWNEEEVQGPSKDTISAWDKVRAEHAPTSDSWSRLRKEQLEGAPKDQNKNQQPRYDNFSDDRLTKGAFSREGQEEGKPAKTNAWGDPI
ncbi:hypothetical protein CLU79DRAFT_723340 [Phycomyces nitens]|nr:hypothetical protein CLU79DRAFT_723340 [Phycomyces nitens]